MGAFVFWRALLALPLLALTAFVRSGGHIALPPQGSRVRTVALALLYFSFQTCWMWGLAKTTPFMAAISSLMIPVFSLLVARAIGAERLSALQTAGAGVTVLGCGLCIPAPAARQSRGIHGSHSIPHSPQSREVPCTFLLETEASHST